MTVLGDDLVRVGRPITEEQATAAILRLIRSPIVGNVDDAETCGDALLRIHGDCYPQLSSGEQRLVDIACAIWTGREDFGARIAAIGDLDHDTRRRVLVVLAYYYLGNDVPLHASAADFDELFVGRRG